MKEVIITFPPCVQGPDGIQEWPEYPILSVGFPGERGRMPSPALHNTWHRSWQKPHATSKARRRKAGVIRPGWNLHPGSKIWLISGSGAALATLWLGDFLQTLGLLMWQMLTFKDSNASMKCSMEHPGPKSPWPIRLLVFPSQSNMPNFSMCTGLQPPQPRVCYSLGIWLWWNESLYNNTNWVFCLELISTVNKVMKNVIHRPRDILLLRHLYSMRQTNWDLHDEPYQIMCWVNIAISPDWYGFNQQLTEGKQLNII